MFNNPLYSNNSMFMKPSLLSGLKNINWGTFLGNAQKTLGVINQAIPIIYQVKPIISNAKTVFKIANSLKDINETPVNNISDNNSNYNKRENSYTDNISSNKPIFYL